MAKVQEVALNNAEMRSLEQRRDALPRGSSERAALTRQIAAMQFGGVGFNEEIRAKRLAAANQAVIEAQEAQRAATERAATIINGGPSISSSSPTAFAMPPTSAMDLSDQMMFRSYSPQ